MTGLPAKQPYVELQIDARDWSLLLFLSVLWGGTFFFTSVALKELPPLTLVLARLVIATAIILPIAWSRGIPFPTSLEGWRPYVVIGLLNNAIPFSLIVTGQTYISGGLASVINAMTPVFAVLIAAAFGQERLLPRRIAGVVLGLAGVVILKDPGFDLGSRQTIGILFCLSATISYGFGALWATRQLVGSPPIGTATFQMMSSSVIMFVVAAMFEQPWLLPMPGAQTIAAILGIASLSTALAFVIFFEIIRRSGATNVMLVTLLVPVSAMLLGYFILEEAIESRQIIGALIIASALLVMDGRLLRLSGRFKSA